MDELARKIEEAYRGIIEATKRIMVLSDTIDDLKVTTGEIIDKYTKAIDQSKLEETRKVSQKALQGMMSEIDKVETLIKEFEYTKLSFEDGITNFTERLKSLENHLKTNKSSIDEIDRKLVKHLKSAEMNSQLGVKRLNQATKLMQAKEEIEKYDELLKLERENNKILKLLQKQLLNDGLPKEPSFMNGLNKEKKVE